MHVAIVTPFQDSNTLTVKKIV